MLPQHKSVFLGEHRGNVYIKKINMNHLSLRTQLKTLHVWITVSPSEYTLRKNDHHVLFYKLDENKMSIPEVTDCTRMSNLFPKWRLSHYLNGFAMEEIVVCFAKVCLKTFLLIYSHELEAVVQRCAVKKGILRNFAKFTGKYLCQGLFLNKVAGLRHWYFPVNFAKSLRTPFFTEHLWWLLLMNGIVFLCIWRITRI